MDRRKTLAVVFVCLLAVVGVAGIAFAAGGGETGGSGGSAASVFCEAPSISVKDQLGQPVENAVIGVTFSSGTASKAMDVTTPVSGTVTLGAVPGSYTFELKSVPSAYTIGSTTKIVQDCQDGKAMDGKTFTVTNTVASNAINIASGGTTVVDGSFDFNFGINFLANIIEQPTALYEYISEITKTVVAEQTKDNAPQETTVPNLVGLTQNEAKTALANAGLLLGDVRFVSDGEPFAVVEQAVSPGESVARNSTINLVVSTGISTPTPEPTTTVKPTPTPDN